MKIERLLLDQNQYTHTPELATQLRQKFPMLQVVDLGASSGDLQVRLGGKTVAFELKLSANDFVNSITERRMFIQAEGLAKMTPWAWLLYPDFKYDEYGLVVAVWENGYGAHPHWNRDHVEGALTHVQRRGVMTRPIVGGVAMTVERILRWIEKWDKGMVTRPEYDVSPYPKEIQEAINFLTLFRGVGVVQARNFIDWAGPQPLYKYLELACKPFRENDKPVGWTNNTINRIRKQMGYVPEWYEELDT